MFNVANIDLLSVISGNVT